MSSIESFIEVPFHFRHCCWFCGEPAASEFTFPHNQHLIFDCPHPTVTLPSCDECFKLAMKARVRSINEVKSRVNQGLVQRYKRDLAIGINWTKAELENSGFEEGSFAGFQKSAWFMFEVARNRVNFNGWPLVVAGVELISDFEDAPVFLFDGIYYPNIDTAITQFTYVYGLDRQYFRQVLAKLGTSKFADAVRFCRLLVGSTPNEKALALTSLVK